MTLLNYLGGEDEACLHCIDSFTFWVSMVNPGFIPSNNMPYKLVRYEEVQELLR